MLLVRIEEIAWLVIPADFKVRQTITVSVLKTTLSGYGEEHSEEQSCLLRLNGRWWFHGQHTGISS